MYSDLPWISFHFQKAGAHDNHNDVTFIIGIFLSLQNYIVAMPNLAVIISLFIKLSRHIFGDWTLFLSKSAKQAVYLH